MNKPALALAILFLAGCGADYEPTTHSLYRTVWSHDIDRATELCKDRGGLNHIENITHPNDRGPAFVATCADEIVIPPPNVKVQ